MTSRPETSGWRRFLPVSMHGQLLLALLIGLPLMQGINMGIVLNLQSDYWERAERVRAENIASHYFLLEGLSPEQRAEAVGRMGNISRSARYPEVLEFFTGPPDWLQEEPEQTARQIRLVRDTLAGYDYAPQITARLYENTEDHPRLPRHIKIMKLAVSFPDGTWMAVSHPERVDSRLNIWLKRAIIPVESLIMVWLIIILLRRLTDPLRQLGLAVDAFGRHPEMSTPLPENGTSEIREVSQSFNRMRFTICRNIDERKRMLMAMAHDLRTPLTRAQLRLEKVQPEALREQLGADVSEVQSIVNQGFELSASLHTAEEFTPLNLESFIQSIVDDNTDMGNAVILREFPADAAAPLVVLARPMCLKRCVENLISNAVKYGGAAEVLIALDKENVVIDVIDNGPGIPEHFLEQVFDPYFRLETSRNRSFGGIGLGLYIARNMALLNNGRLTLENRTQGGLSAKLTLPRYFRASR